MRKIALLIVAFIFFYLAVQSSSLHAQQLPIVNGANEHLQQGIGLSRIEGELVVKFRPGTSGSAIDGLNALLGARLLKLHRLSQTYRLGFPTSANLAQVLTAYRNSAIVEEAGFNFRMRAFAAPNDPYYQPYQWNFYNTGYGIRAEQAWDNSANKGQGAIVAIIDTGAAFESNGPFVQAPDLNKNFVSPWNFLTNDSHADDDHGHGTHVAGTIAQDTNNNLATAGIAYQASIMPLKVLDSSGSGSSDDLNEAIYYAVNNGAKVINMSLGFDGTGSPDGSGQVCTEIPGLNAALQNAYDHGVVVVAAAGNDGGNTVNCPAAYPTVIAVGATRYDGQRTFYSTGGSALDIVAPGGDPNVDQNGDGYGDGILQVTFCYDPDTMALYWELLGVDLYTEFCSVFYAGTSMATPHVTGTAAIILSEKPGATPDQVRSYLQSTARDLGDPGWDSSYGWGLLDAGAAVMMATGGTPPPPPPPPPTTGSITGVVKNNSTGVAINGAKITAKVGSATYTTTQTAGFYTLSNLPLNTYNVTASATGYTAQTKSVTLTIGTPDVKMFDFTLAKKGKK